MNELSLPESLFSLFRPVNHTKSHKKIYPSLFPPLCLFEKETKTILTISPSSKILVLFVSHFVTKEKLKQLKTF
jgi:hypothetical protein